MAKKSSSSSSRRRTSTTSRRSSTAPRRSEYKHAKVIRILAGLGAALSLYYHIVIIALQFTAFSVLPLFNPLGGYHIAIVIVIQIIAIILNFVLLGSLGAFKTNLVVRLKWYTILAFGIVDVILGGSLGGLLIIVAAIFAIFDRM